MLFFFTLISVCFSTSLSHDSYHQRRRLVNHPNWNLLDHQNCGESFSDRIIGGTVADMGEFPWLARLGYINPNGGIFRVRSKHSFKCGGSLINPIYVLTAAHCVSKLGDEQLALIRLGEYDVRKEIDCDDAGCAPPVQDFTPNKTIVHKNYNDQILTNDIALIRLNRPARYNFFVSTVCLPYGKLLKRSHLLSRFTVAGWGVTDISTMKVSDVPLFVHLNIAPMEECIRKLKIRSSGVGQLCAGGVKGYDSCSGDSGGPLMVVNAIDGPPKYYQMGLVSFGSEKCGGDKPAIYTDVRHYMVWILNHIEP